MMYSNSNMMQAAAWDVQQPRNAKKFDVRQRRAGPRRGGKGTCLQLNIPQGVLLEKNATAAVHMQAGQPVKAQRYNELQTTEQVSCDSPLALLNSPERCNEVLEKLEGGSPADRHELLMWLHTAMRPLALSKPGCRIVQKAFEVANASDRDLIIMELEDHIVELYESPWGNHVLSRAIEVLPAAKTTFVIAALRGRGVLVSKHRFGCRVVCRLIEHCTEDQIGELLHEVLVEADSLARHAYGNFIVQSTFEHASPARRSAVLYTILPDFTSLAMHRTGSLVVQRALDYCDAKGQALAIQALLQGDNSSLVEVACSHYGSYVIEQSAGLRNKLSGMQEFAQTLAIHLPELQASEHAERVIVAFGLAPVEQLTDA